MKKNAKKIIKTRQINSIQCVWAITCNSSIVDQYTNSFSLINLIEEISIPSIFFAQQKENKKPIMCAFSHDIVLYFRRTLDVKIAKEEIMSDIKIQTINPKGAILGEVLTPFKFLEGKKNMRVKIQMQGIIADIPGDYIYKIEIQYQDKKDFEYLTEIPFTVKEIS